MTTFTAPTFVVLMPGADARVLGGSVRVRNTRVAARVGASVIDLAAALDLPHGCAVVVPPHALIDPLLFAQPLPRIPTWLQDPDNGPAVLAGPARDVARFSVDAGTVFDGGGFPRQMLPRDALFDVSTAAARRRATWRVLERTEKPTDGWVSRHFNRPVSRLCSFGLLALRLKASHASAIALLVGVAAAALALRPGYRALVGTGILFQLASVLDGVDGEIARATLTESESGARLDAIIDQFTYVACFIGVTIGWAREGGGPQAIFWMGTIAIALVLSLVRGGRFVSRHAPDASFVFIDRSVRRAASEFDFFALRMAAGSFSLLRRDLFAVIFLIVTLFGRRALVPALVGGGIILANVTFSVYRRELEAGAVLERGYGPPASERDLPTDANLRGGSPKL